MKARCVQLVEKRIGRPLQPGEERFIEQTLLGTLRTEMRENPAKTRALNHGQRIRLAANRAARDLGREQAVTEWNDTHLDELWRATREEFVKAGFKVNPEFHDNLEGPAAVAFEDAIAFSLEHVDGKSVAAAIRSMQGTISHELTHVAQDLGAFTPEQVNDLNYAAEHKIFTRSDARMIGEEDVHAQLGPKPTYRDYADKVYADRSEDVRAREAVAKGIEVEAARHARDMEPANTVFREALGSLVKMGRTVMRAVKRLTNAQQEGLRRYFAGAERALRRGDVNRQRYGNKVEPTPTTRIGKISDAVLKNLPEEEINDLVRRLDNPLATAAEISDAPIWDTLEQMQNGPTMRPEQANDPAFWASRRYEVDGKTLTAGELVSHVTALFAERAGKQGVILGRRATIVTGAPGAGKSSITNHIAKAGGAAVIEADVVKPLIPEYNGGINQLDVHPESQAISGQAMRQLMEHGANLVLERIGNTPDGMANLVNILKTAGYKVDVVHVRSDFSTRVRGAAARFLANGRWIPPSDQIEIGNAPTSVHRTVVRNNLANGTFEVRLNSKGTYDVISQSGKANRRLASAITRAAGGRLARLGQALGRARFADPRSYALESAKAFRNWNKEVGPTIGRPMANFGGKHAKGADITALRLANQMAKDGVDKNTIRHRTGWFQPQAGGKWRFTLPSGKVTLKRAFAEAYAKAHAAKKPVRVRLGDAVDSGVFEAYPSLRNFPLIVNPFEVGAGVKLGFGKRYMAMEVGYVPQAEGRHEQFIAHELSHLVAMIEGFERGGSPEQIARGIRKGKDADIPDWAIDFVQEQDQNLSSVMSRAVSAYVSLIGETEARDAEIMESMTPAERKAFEPSITYMDGLPSQKPFEPTLLEQLKNMPMKWWATIPPGGFIIETLRELLMQTHHAIPPEELFNLPKKIEEAQSDANAVRPDGSQSLNADVADVPQELGLQRVHAQRFADMADRYPPFAKALEKAGIERMPKTLTREQYVRLRRAMRDITDLDFIGDLTPLQKKYSTGPTQAAMKFKNYAVAEKDFLHFLENGMMDGGFSAAAVRPRMVMDIQGSDSVVIANPSKADIQKMTRPVRGRVAQDYNTIRYIKDNDGNIFVSNGPGIIHDTIARTVKKNGYALDGYLEHSDSGDRYSHGPFQTGILGPRSFPEDWAKAGIPQPQAMEARKPQPMKTYNAKGGRKGAMNSSTAYASIPPQPGFIDDVNYVANQIGQIKYRNVAGVMIQDKRMQKLRPWNIAGGKLDEIDKITEGVLKKVWGGILRNTPVIRGMVQGYFPFGGVPDRVALELLRSLAQGRTGAAQDIAREVAGGISRALKISPMDAIRAMRGDYSKQQHVADLMEQVRDAMTDPDPTTQAAKMAALRAAEPELYAAVKRARDVIMDIGDALVEHGIIHQNQLNKYQGHYLRRAYMEHFESYRPSAGVRASGAHYRKYREGIPLDRRLTKGEIKDVPFLTYLSIEEPLRDLGLYSYLNAIVHYSATAPSNPGWVLPDSIVMFGGKYRTLFYIAKEKEQNDRSLQQKRNQLTDMGGASATNPAAQRLKREITILDQISKDMENIINTNPAYARALKKGEMPKGYRQLPDDTARFGDMAGAIVMRALYDDIMGGTKEISLDPESFKQRAADFYNAINRNAKFLLTVANPPTHLRNVYSNIISLARSGTNPARVLQAIYEVSNHLNGKKTSPAVAAAIKFGAMKQSFTEAELRLMDEFARNVQLQEKRAESKRRKDARAQAVGPASLLINAPLTALDVAGMIGGAMKDKYASGASWLYQMEDVVFKVAKIADEIDRGTPPALAALEARKHFFDYSAVTDPVRWLRNSAIAPFISYVYFAVPNFIEQAATAPWRLGLSTYLPALGLLALFGMLWGYQPDEAKKALSRALRDRPMMLPIPWRDEHDRLQWVDLGYMLPEGNMIGMLADAARGDFGGAINSIGFSGGPAITAMIGLQTGVDPFRGTPIWDETDDEVTRSEKGFAFAARSFMPSALNYYIPPLPGEDVGGPGYEVLAGTGEDRYGEPTQTPGQLASRMAGINIYPSDVNYGRIRQIRQYTYQVNQLRQSLRRAYIDQRLTPTMRERRITRLTDQMNRIQTEFSNYVNQTANAADIESRRHSE